MQIRSKRRTKRKAGGRPRFIPMDIDNAVQRSIVKRSEKHWLDTTIAATPVLTTWSFILLNGISQGDDYNQRQGDKVTMLTQRLRISISTDAEPAINKALLRLVLIHDAQPNGADPTGATVFNSDNLYRYANHGYRQRFTVLKDNLINFDEESYSKIWHKWNKKIPKNLSDARYSGTGATIASIASGSLFLGFCADVLDGVQLIGSSRLVYTDV